ncbi:MAG: hypothetical protein WC710_14630 [Gallionella sp.]|jgi:hypothetical protein
MSESSEAQRLREQQEFEAKRAAKRAAFPSVTAIVDEFRLHFGDGVRALGGRDFVTNREIGWNPSPSPNCDACTGHDGSPGCSRMDRIAYGHDKPEPDKVFCGFRLVKMPVIKEKGNRR